jgi:NADH-quinone oxidoreductase subunit G
MLSLVLPEANSFGLGLMGGGDLASALRSLRDEQADTVIILENDLYLREESAIVDAALRAAKHVIVIDHVMQATAQKADAVFPAVAFAEDSGTLVSSEGRAQRFFQALLPQNEMQSSWRWLRDLEAASSARTGGAWRTLDDIVADIAADIPFFRPILEIAPSADFRSVGQKVPRQSPRYSGRTAIDAKENVSEPKPPEDLDTPLAFSMEGEEGHPSPALLPRYWEPGWNSAQAVNKFQSEIGGALRGGDPGRRLVEPLAGAQPEYFRGVPAALAARDGQLLAVPLYHIFGSEPLSMLSPAIAQLAPQPYVALPPGEAARYKVAEGDIVQCKVDDHVFELPVKLLASLAEHTAGLPAGLPMRGRWALPVWIAITKKSQEAGNA